MAYTYNYRMANKGKGLEDILEYQNELYSNKKISTVQKIPTSWKIVRRYGKIVDAYPEKKSTLDYRGAALLVDGNAHPISFDAKETDNEKGLPLKNIEQHQIDFISDAICIGEIAFVLCYMLSIDKFFYIEGNLVVDKYNRWKANKGKRGYNTILIEEMELIPQTPGNVCDYLAILNRRLNG